MLADVARCEGDYDRATLLCQEALPLWLQAGDRTSYASTLLSLADAELQQGRIAEATSRYVEGLALCREMGSVRYGVSAVAGLAGIARRIGRLQEDARLLGAVEALCEARAIRYWTADRLRNEREVAAVRVALPAAEVADLWAEGRSLSIEEAIATALDAFR